MRRNGPHCGWLVGPHKLRKIFSETHKNQRACRQQIRTRTMGRNPTTVRKRPFQIPSAQPETHHRRRNLQTPVVHPYPSPLKTPERIIPATLQSHLAQLSLIPRRALLAGNMVDRLLQQLCTQKRLRPPLSPRRSHPTTTQRPKRPLHTRNYANR